MAICTLWGMVRHLQLSLRTLGMVRHAKPCRRGQATSAEGAQLVTKGAGANPHRRPGCPVQFNFWLLSNWKQNTLSPREGDARFFSAREHFLLFFFWIAFNSQPASVHKPSPHPISGKKIWGRGLGTTPCPLVGYNQGCFFFTVFAKSFSFPLRFFAFQKHTLHVQRAVEVFGYCTGSKIQNVKNQFFGLGYILVSAVGFS